MKSPNLLVIISLISFLSIILITNSPFKSYTNSFDNNNPILLEIPSIQAQDDGNDVEDDDDFAGFEEEDDDNGRDDDDFAGFEEEDDDADNEKEKEKGTNQFSFELEETEDQEDEGGNDDAIQETDQFAFETEESEDKVTEDREEEDQQLNLQGQQDEGTDEIAESILKQASDNNAKPEQEEQQDEGTDDIEEQIQKQAEQIQEQEGQQDEGTDDIEEQIQKQAKQIQEQEEQKTFREDIEQKINQMADQIAKSSEDQGSEEPSDVQQLIKKIVIQPSKDDSDVNQIVDQISKQINNNPKSDLAKSLGNLAGLYGSGNKDQVNQVIKQIGTQIAIGDNINQNTIQNIVQKAYQVTNNYFKNKIKYDIDYDKHHHDHDNVKIIKKIYKRDNTCPTQSDSTLLKGKILGKGVTVLADFKPCELRDGRATLNIPNNPNLKFVVLSIDKKGNNPEGIIAYKQKIQSLGKDSGLYIVNFDNKMTGIDPITGKKKTLDDINGLALYNTSTKPLNFKSGNSLALTAVLKK